MRCHAPVEVSPHGAGRPLRSTLRRTARCAAVRPFFRAWHRTINRRLRTALALRDRRCVVPGCPVAYGLEIDHLHPLESGGRTELDNLALLCHHHHRMKTYDGWVLERTGPTDEDPRWRFPPSRPSARSPTSGSTGPRTCRGEAERLPRRPGPQGGVADAT